MSPILQVVDPRNCSFFQEDDFRRQFINPKHILKRRK